MTLAFILAAAGCQGTSNEGGGKDTEESAHQAPAQDPIHRGEYLVMTSGCNDCHTPWVMGAHGPEPDMTRFLSGHPAGLEMPPGPSMEMPWAWAGSASMTAFHGPWGTTFAPNLTPDMEDGLGAWDEHLFVTAIREGKIRGAGRPILPPMPWQNYAKLTDDDLSAMFQYLQTITAVKNEVPDYRAPEGGGGQ